MLQLQLTSQQRELLAEILQSAVFKDRLRQRKQVLSEILAEVSSAKAEA